MAATQARPTAGPGASSYAKLVQLRKGSADPLAQTSPAAINSTVNRTYGSPLSEPQITERATGELDPILQAAAAAITGQAGRASSAITLNSGQLAKDLAAEDFGSHYDTAKQEQAAVDAALQESLDHAGGTGLAQDLSTRLGQIDDPAVAALAGATASRGAAIGTTELARGSANLSNLIAEAAAAKTYGAKQPGIARLAGLQDVAGVQSKALDDLANSKTQILDQLPTIVNELRSSNDSLRGNRAQLLATLLGQNITKATAQAGLEGATTKAVASAAAADAKAARPDPSLSRAVGYQVDSNGKPIGGKVTPLPGYTLDPHTGAVVKQAKPTVAKAAKPLTVTEGRGVVEKASAIANGALSGGNDKSGTYHPPLSYPDALNELRNEGLLADPRSARLAIATLDRVYKTNASPSDQVDLMTQHGIKPTGPGLTAKQKKIDNALFPLNPFGH